MHSLIKYYFPLVFSQEVTEWHAPEMQGNKWEKKQKTEKIRKLF